MAKTIRETPNILHLQRVITPSIRIIFTESFIKLPLSIPEELLTVSHHPDNFGDHCHCASGELTILICPLASSDRVREGLVDFMGGSPSRYVTTCHVLWPLV